MADQLTTDQNNIDTLGSRLDASPTAYAPDTNPSKSDVSIDTSLTKANQAIETLKSKQLRNEWYGPTVAKNASDPNSGVDTSEGFLTTALKGLQRPLNAIAGTVQYALGKGPKPDLVSNINNAMNTGLDFGNILTQYGTPRAAQIPLGFALDVAFDPINWLTMGGSTLVGGATEGLIKGFGEAGTESGIRGALDAAGTNIASNLTRKASTVMNLMPFSRKIGGAALAEAPEGAKLGAWDATKNLVKQGFSKYNEGTDALAARSIAGTEKFNELTGTSVIDKLNKGIFGQPAGALGNFIENKVRDIPSYNIFGKATPTGDSIADFFKYSPREATQLADLRDKVINLGKKQGIILVGGKNGFNFKNIDDFLKPGATVPLKNALGDSFDLTIRGADGVLSPDFPKTYTVADNQDNAIKLLQMAGEDFNMNNLIKAYTTTARGTSGVKVFDDWVQNLKDTKIGDFINKFGMGIGNVEPNIEQVYNDSNELIKTINSYSGVRDMKPIESILNAYQNQFIPLFRSAKTAMNPATAVVVGLGHYFMGFMMGLPSSDPEFIASVIRGKQLYAGKLGAAGLRDIFMSDNASLLDMLRENPTRFRQFTNLSPSEITNKISAEQVINGWINSTDNNSEVLRLLQQGADLATQATARVDTLGDTSNLEKIANEAVLAGQRSKATEEAITKAMGRYETPAENVAKKISSVPIKRADEFSTDTNIMGATDPDNFLQALQRWAKNGAEDPKNAKNPAWKMVNFVVNGLPRNFQEIPQATKLGTVDYLSRVGLTEQQLIRVSQSVPIDFQKDIISSYIKGANKMYRLTPMKGSEIALETYMNYAAIPDFVRVMRALPIVGVPFFSFPYAMAVKTGKTIINNPAVFNKVAFMINEMNADRSPEEKVALQQKYNEYLNSPSVVKMFGMWNTDIGKLVPYFHMNMFNPSQKTYGNTFQDQILKLSDQFPVLQDPVGSMIKDYFIQPWILSGSGEMPQGTFGEPLVPSFDANGKPITPSLGTQAFYGARALTESIVPGALSYLGLLNAPGELSPEMVNMIPSYGFRDVANAANADTLGNGRSSIGATTKENAMQKTFRAILGRTGIPAYTLDTTTTTPKPFKSTNP